MQINPENHAPVFFPLFARGGSGEAPSNRQNDLADVPDKRQNGRWPKNHLPFRSRCLAAAPRADCASSGNSGSICSRICLCRAASSGVAGRTMRFRISQGISRAAGFKKGNSEPSLDTPRRQPAGAARFCSRTLARARSFSRRLGSRGCVSSISRRTASASWSHCRRYSSISGSCARASHGGRIETPSVKSASCCSCNSPRAPHGGSG